ncbi:hypothetical protein ACX8XP_10770 [Calditrichota bacterium LG25]
MSAFFLYSYNYNFDLKEVKNIFKKQGFTEPIEFDFNTYKLWVYKKILTNDKNYFLIDSNNLIVAIGTLVYKGENYYNSIKQILIDFIKKKFSIDDLLGHYVIFLKINGKCKFFIDRSNIQNLYYNKEKTILSSSFLATSIVNKKLSINNNAVTEILLTGGLNGPDTIFNEIKRFEHEEDITFPDLEYIKFPSPEYKITNKKKELLISDQLDILDSYFNQIKNLADEKGVLIGLTGGFDSRLLMCFAEKHFNNISYFSHWRKKRTKELEIAEELANIVQKKLRIFQVAHPLDMTEDEALLNLDKSFYQFDGHIRTQAYWHEPYNTLDYIKKIYADKFLGLYGIGGEQYRNYERMIKPRWNYHSWLKYEILFRYSDNIFITTKDEKDFINYFSEKLNKKLGLNKPNFVNHLIVKRYFNEVYNISNRTVRISIENKAVYFLSPFADPYISYKAYEIVERMGNSLQFQAEMIKRINPNIAKINSVYGFNFYDGENLKSKFSSYLKEMLPKSLFFYFYHKMKKSRSDVFYNTYSTKFDFMNKFEEKIYDLGLTINIDRLKKIKDTGWLLIALGYFLYKFEDKLG